MSKQSDEPIQSPANNQQVLSHYFNELLPEKQDNLEQDSLTTDEKKSDFTATPTVQSQREITHSIEDSKPRVNHSVHTPETQSALKTTALKPLSEDPYSTSTDEDSAAYKAHKQRLERMLEQLTPVKPQVLVEPPQEITTIPQPDEVQTSTTEELSAPQASDQALAFGGTQLLSSEWLDNGRPHWAQQPFDILLIEVNGLKLAVPLIALGHIEPMEEELTPLFGQAHWFLGLQKTVFGNLKTIDTAEYVMPERTLKDQTEDYRFVVSISGMDWGLAVHSIDQPILIDPESIRWRAKRENRPWMAGTLKDHMCVLLDIPVMGEILQKEDKNHRILTGD